VSRGQEDTRAVQRRRRVLLLLLIHAHALTFYTQRASVSCLHIYVSARTTRRECNRNFYVVFFFVNVTYAQARRRVVPKIYTPRHGVCTTPPVSRVHPRARRRPLLSCVPPARGTDG